jgi:alkanesulfonate monooxygenase SsuD/methylene tetrahydromethanopterin reductase-like flavin-dependent oxidoreductase (luciferase family)
MFPNPTGLLRLEPYSAGLRDRIWWGSASNATAVWAAKVGMNLQSSTLKFDETGEPLHIQQAAQIRAFRAAWKEAGHKRTPRVSVSRSVFALIDDRDRAYFGRGGQEDDKIGFLDENTRAIFGRSYAAEPDILVEQLRNDEAIAEADTLLLTNYGRPSTRLALNHRDIHLDAEYTTMFSSWMVCFKSDRVRRKDRSADCLHAGVHGRGPVFINFRHRRS